MYLKRLEIQGFKSMADRVELQFNPGITAVVGPNGSGKSNISDAIRWVLGEQSAKSLRGAKMEDIIFSGSDKRKPVGMAEVILTLDNSTGIFPTEFSEVNVTRRVFRSGESEFFINKTPCRLKDIHELFMDTGIGREGYSIIGQGKIDEILSTKSEDRRQVIEEAAGIVKYKNRKIQAVRKLEDTEQNLLRISDIITELENQVGPLEEQAVKAGEYIKHKKELDQLEISLSVQQLADQKARLDSFTLDEDRLRREMVSLETEVRKTDSIIEELKHKLNLTNENITEQQQNIYEKNSAIEKLEAEIRLNEERLNNLSERKGRLEGDIAALKEKVEGIQLQSKDDREACERLRGSISALAREVTALEEALDSLEAGNRDKTCEIERIKGEIFDTLNSLAGLNNQLHALEAEENSILYRQEQLNRQREQQQEEQTGFSSNINEIEKAESDAASALKTLATRTQALVSEINETNFKFNKAGEAARALNSEKQNLVSKLKVLEEMEQDYEGYYKGVREVLKAAQNKKLSGICGVVAELLSVPKKFEIAIEVALGGALQHLVAVTDKDAKEAINFLKRTNAGRATFLPLNTVKAKEVRNAEKILREKGCLGLASSLVSFDKQYEPAVNSLLGNILVTEDIDVALKIARDTNYGVKIVALEGDVINPGGSLTGGTYSKNRSNLLGRKREIDEITLKIHDYTEKTEAADGEIENLRKKAEDLQLEMETAKEQMQQLNLKTSGLAAEKEQLRIQLQKALQTIEFYNLEAAQVEDRLQEIQFRKKEIELEVTRLNKLNQELNQKVLDSQQHFSTLEQQKVQVLDRLTAQKVDLAKLRQEEVGYGQILERVNRDVQEVEEQIGQKTGEISSVEVQEVSLAKASEEIRGDIGILLEEKLDMEEQLKLLKNIRDNCSSDIAAKEEASKSSYKEFNNLQNQIHGIEVKLARLEAEIDNEQKKLTEEFDLTYEEALLRKTEIGSKREATTRIKELKGLISILGTVNLAAIEEFEKVKERYDFLKGQYADLEEARVALYKVIEEMDQIMSKRFRKAYEQINENFQGVFRELFGGGHAELQMTDGENILETGVEIIAQPPGKKPQHLSLLSGGERALTAISLLFAVLMVKPSPFCVLDEIEASLDEANVDRFASFLDRFSRETQFIVVTHRKGTMEAANVLYGVTMDESGVSKMVSMKLSDAVDKVS